MTLSTADAFTIKVESYAAFQQKAKAFLCGEDLPTDATEVSVVSFDALGQILTPENIRLLGMIAQKRPETIGVLATLLEREPSNVSRALARLEQFGLVRFVRNGREKRPELVAERLTIELNLTETPLTATRAAAPQAAE